MDRGVYDFYGARKCVLELANIVETHAAPSYLSQSKAETILSEVRPTKLRTETLICVNVFLDELLWLVLSTARSFSTDRLKIGLLKVLPTTLGKDALLEAELELKAYWEKTGLHILKALENAPTPSTTDFPLQAAFELLRHKCEAYSTLGDLDEDADVEARLQGRMVQAASNPPNSNAVAPAALYLTAVLEHVCEHVLGNLARVVGRDASRATAQVGDLYVALCEDETIYGLFKTMKGLIFSVATLIKKGTLIAVLNLAVHEQIDRQSKSPRPRRSKSFTRADNSSSSRTASPQPQPQAMEKTRSSAETNGGLLASGHAPQSSDKMRGLKMFKNSSFDAQTGKDHQRSMSVMSDATKRTMLAFQNGETEGENSMQDFDDLMRSGTTMKVSLTPDRLKTFEVYNKQKIAKASRPTPTPSANTEPAPPFKSLRPVASSKSIGRSLELSDDRESANLSSKRTHSIATPAEAGIRVGQTRRGSGSSGSTPPSTNPTLLRKASAGNGFSSGPSSYTPNIPTRRTTEPADMSNGMPKRNRPTGRARNRESLDLDDIMGLEDEMAFGPPPMMPKAATPAATSSSTRDLIDFLSEGPPETPDLPPLQTNLNMNDKAPKSASRLRSMFSRGTRQSNDGPIASASVSNLQARPMNGSSSLGRSNSNLKKQRSAGNLEASRQPAQPLPPVEYPRPPQFVRSSAPPSPTHSSPAIPQTSSPAEPNQANMQPERSRHISVTRKAAPVWDAQSQSLPVPSPTLSPRSPSDNKPPPPSPKASLPSTSIPPTNGYPVQLNVSNIPSEATGPPASPLTPSKRSGLMPTPRSAGIPNLPAAKAVDIMDMRKKLARATSVPEARLLVDMFLAQWGFPAERLAESDSAAPASVVLNGGDKDDTQGVSVVEMLLGEGTEAPQSPLEAEDGQGQTHNQTSSPTVSHEPMSASSLSAFKITSPGTKGVRVDTKQSPSAGTSPTGLSANSGTMSHTAIHHHRYGNGSPVIVG
ncbi:hypothetical protein FRC17_007126 [Serendipita sp. 399]|nr:hypothetical protein FRC17_007126 [Serendipita sp. 399]